MPQAPGIHHPARRTPALQETAPEAQNVIGIFKVIRDRAFAPLHERITHGVGALYGRDPLIIGTAHRVHQPFNQEGHRCPPLVAVHGCQGFGSPLLTQGRDSTCECFDGLIPGNVHKPPFSPQTDPLHRTGKPERLVIEQLEPTHPHGANATGVHRVIGTAFDLYRPIFHLFDLDAASARTEVAHRVDLCKLARRGDRDPWPVLGPYGYIVC